MDTARMDYKVDHAVGEVLKELDTATLNYGAFHSPHEGFAIILEELDELKAEVWKRPELRDQEKLRAEAKQVAAMALRFMVDCAS